MINSDLKDKCVRRKKSYLNYVGILQVTLKKPHEKQDPK